MIHLKPGVRLIGVQPALVLAIMVADGVYASRGFDTMVITSVTDGTHMRASLHYVGSAFDARFPEADSPGAAVQRGDEIRQRLAEALGPDFDVVLERDHIHVEWQPKVEYS